MSWYSAHIIMFVELKAGAQDRFPVWENVVLIRAETEDEAFEKAERHGRLDEGDDGGSFRWGKQPARWVFAGVRKLTACPMLSDQPDDGTEVTYNELELSSREDVTRLAVGDRVLATYNDRYRPPERKARKTEGQAKGRRRKRA